MEIIYQQTLSTINTQDIGYVNIPEGGYLSPHVDVDADAGSVTHLILLMMIMKGGWITFWGKYNILSGATLLMYIQVITCLNMKSHLSLKREILSYHLVQLRKRKRMVDIENLTNISNQGSILIYSIQRILKR